MLRPLHPGTHVLNRICPLNSITKTLRTTPQSLIQRHKSTTTTTTTTTTTNTNTGNPITMADDTSYATFLSKANADPTSGSRPTEPQTSTSQARSQYDPSTTQAGIPVPLQTLPDTPYTSDTDSDWEVVFFNYASDDLPDLEGFQQVLRAKGGGGDEVQELSLGEFDPRGRYGEVVGRVRRVGVEARGDGGGVKVFRVQRGATRVEYFVLTVADRKLVGVVARAVES